MILASAKVGNLLIRDPTNTNLSNNGSTLMQLKRKRIKELLLAGGIMTGGQVKPHHINFSAIEKEELIQQKRTLKMQINVMRDENTRLKTKMAFIQGEMDRKDRDIELLSLKVH
jgi:hypothetical protein